MRRFIAFLIVVSIFGVGTGCDQHPKVPPIVPNKPPENPDPGNLTRSAVVPTTDPYNETAAKVVYLSQNWSPDDSLTFYFTAQGSQIIPYEWFLALEQPGESKTPFRDNQNILKYRYLTQKADQWNPDGLPVGFVGESAAGVKWLGMTCAACHTTELHVNNVAVRVDGAPTQGNVQALISDMIVAVKNTLDDTTKFERFAREVLGGNNDAPKLAGLKKDMANWIAIRSGYNQRNFPGYDPKAITPQGPQSLGRFGQLDAVGAIVNEVYWNADKNQDLNNPTIVAHKADAPVSYPFIWNAHQQDRVQWLGIAQSGGVGNIFSMVRNVGEVVGVFGHVEVPKSIPTLNPGYPSTIDRKSLEKLEDLITTLWSPLWPEDTFGKIDRDSATKGEEVFKRKLEQNFSCFDCHGQINRVDPERKFAMRMFATGTDARAYNNFFVGDQSRPSGKLEGVPVNFIPLTEKIGARATPTQMITNEVVGIILATYTSNPPPDQLKTARYGKKFSAGITASAPEPQYEARPLNGIWATAPYLHNGSVPTLDALFRKAADRPKTFSVGVRAFDTKKVGLGEAPANSNLPKLDSTLPGNSNVGHEFGSSLTEPERIWLIDYLKSL
jgi:hypothetical protein